MRKNHAPARFAKHLSFCRRAWMDNRSFFALNWKSKVCVPAADEPRRFAEHPCKLTRAFGPRNSMKIVSIQAIIQNGGEMARSRSEERRVGKEGRSRGGAEGKKKKEEE